MATVSWPPRDEAGRVIALVDLLALAVLGLALGVVALTVIDGIVALLGLGRFGATSGWIAGILLFWVYLDEFRAWRAVSLLGRFGVALAAAAPAVVFGFLGASAASWLPPMFASAIGLGAAALIYGVLWYFGIRWLGRRVGVGAP